MSQSTYRASVSWHWQCHHHRHSNIKIWTNFYFLLFTFNAMVKVLAEVLKTIDVAKSQNLKELRNFILCILCAWSLFYSIRIYISLHFLPIKKIVFCLSVSWLFCLLFFEFDFIKDVFHLCRLLIFVQLLFMNVPSALWFCSRQEAFKSSFFRGVATVAAGGGGMSPLTL